LHPIRHQFAAMAERVPGEFGGLYFDEEGVITIVLGSPELEAMAKVALANESFVQQRRSGPRGERFEMNQARVRTGQYAYNDLLRWYGEIMGSVQVPPIKGSIRVARNRVYIGVRDEDGMNEVWRTADAAGVPRDALDMEIVEPPVMLQHLQLRVRPVYAGFQVWPNISFPPCTIGPSVEVDPGYPWQPYPGFLVNAHCTKNFPLSGVGSDSTLFYQPTSGSPDFIGQEWMEADAFPCSYVGLPYNAYGCRAADASLGKYSSEPPLDSMQVDVLGGIARTDGRNTGSVDLDSTDPLFQIVSRSGGYIEGDTLEKVGRTTGWSGGPVVDSCLDYPRSGLPSLLCVVKVEALAGGGDSGAPIFAVSGDLLSETEVELSGTLWGGDSCQIDPIVCDYFLGSNIELIELEIDAFLSYW
jgi:hypothetical protein